MKDHGESVDLSTGVLHLFHSGSTKARHYADDLILRSDDGDDQGESNF
jgi:hypothetical protein